MKNLISSLKSPLKPIAITMTFLGLTTLSAIAMQSIFNISDTLKISAPVVQISMEKQHNHDAQTESIRLGDIEIISPIIRSTPPKAPVSAGYMTLKNHGSEADYLIGGSASFAGKVEIHEMKMDGDVMKMRELEGGLEIPAGGSVTLKAGGLHVMFMKLTEQMKEGETRNVMLEFKTAGSIEMELPVKQVVRGGHNHSANHQH